MKPIADTSPGKSLMQRLSLRLSFIRHYVRHSASNRPPDHRPFETRWESPESALDFNKVLCVQFDSISGYGSLHVHKTLRSKNTTTCPNPGSQCGWRDHFCAPSIHLHVNPKPLPRLLHPFPPLLQTLCPPRPAPSPVPSQPPI